MQKGISSIREKMLIDSLSSTIVHGKVIKKIALKSKGIEGPLRLLIIRFKDRDIENPVEDAEFERAAIGDTIQFAPPLPDFDSCERCLCICLIAGIAVALLSTYLLTTFFLGRAGVLLAIIASAITGIAAWGKYCFQRHNKFMEDLENELQYFRN